MNKPTNRNEMKEYLGDGVEVKNIVSLGIFSSDFYPYDEEMIIKEAEEMVEDFLKHRFSTVFQGIRYYFQTGAQLKEFCEIVDKD